MSTSPGTVASGVLASTQPSLNATKPGTTPKLSKETPLKKPSKASTEQQSEKQAAKWRQKLSDIDDKATLDHRFDTNLIIWCGRCAKASEQRGRYDLERLSLHRKSQKCQNMKDKPHQRPLDAFTAVVGSVQSDTHKSSSSQTTAATPALHQGTPCPCPGIGEREDPAIIHYLSRTSMATGGASPRPLLRKELRAIHPHVSKGELEDMMLALEEERALWRNLHMSKKVRSTKCTNQAICTLDGEIIPCLPCRLVKSIPTFGNALRRGEGDPAKANRTPHSYRNELMNIACAQHPDVKRVYVRPSSCFRYRWAEALPGEF
jgi:hypothetical protein